MVFNGGDVTEGFALVNAAVPTNVGWFVCSTADADLRQQTWSVNSGYARTYTPVRAYAHREVANRCGYAAAEYVDHINGDRLDNRRENLRPATSQQNARNQRRKAAGKSSRFKGVYWAERANAWRAEITIDARSVKLGYFKDETEAQDAYAKAAEKHFGAYAAPRVEKR